MMVVVIMQPQVESHVILILILQKNDTWFFGFAKRGLVRFVIFHGR